MLAEIGQFREGRILHHVPLKCRPQVSRELANKSSKLTLVTQEVW